MSVTAIQLLTEWNWDPSILVGTGLFVIAYLAAIGPLRPRFESAGAIQVTQVLEFLVGAGVIFFALVSPLDEIGDHYLFTAHMLQHALLMLVAPPLLLLGTPGWVLRPLLLHPRVKRVAQILTLAPVAFLIFNGDLLAWHLPVLYEATLENETIHIVEHLSFIATALLSWWPVLSPLPELPRLPYPGQLVYLILTLIPSALLGWVFVSATTVLYPTYAIAPQVFGIHGLDDQVLGGYMMEFPNDAVYGTALTLILAKWAKAFDA